MRIILIKKSVIIFSTITLLVSSFFFLFFLFQSKTVYKDREYWEQKGDIVWEVDTDNKLIALTFDDGPSPTFTKKILNLLSQYDAKATFFVMGKQAEKFPDLIRLEVKKGHEIGNHTYGHPEVNNISEDELKKDLIHADSVLTNIADTDIKLFRPTSGYYDKTIVNAAKSLNYTVIIWTWNLDSKDWTQLDGETIAHRLIKNIKPGSIVLFHDLGGDRSNTVKALQIILPVLKEQGFRFVTVSSLLKYNTNVHNVNN